MPQFPGLSRIFQHWKNSRIFQDSTDPVINIWFAIRRLDKYILYAEGLSKGTQATLEMKCRNEKMTCNTQDTNLSWYVPKDNVDHTIKGQGTSTLDHSATTPRANCHGWEDQKHNYMIILKISHFFWCTLFYLSMKVPILCSSSQICACCCSPPPPPQPAEIMEPAGITVDLTSKLAPILQIILSEQ